MSLVWWMRAVGALYVLMGIVAIGPRAPIKAEGPPGILEKAAAGDPTARFVVDTWIMIGLFFAVIGVALLVASRDAQQARSLAWTVLGIELFVGMVIDVYKLFRGYRRTPPLVWIVIHTVVIVTGVLSLRATP